MISHQTKTTPWTGSNFWLAIVMIGVGVGCQSASVPPDGDQGNGMVSYAADIEPILTTLCGTCHRDGGIADQAGIDLRLTEEKAFEMLLSNTSVQDPSFAFVVPGDAESSLLFLKINSDNPPVGERMPFEGAPLNTS